MKHALSVFALAFVALSARASLGMDAVARLQDAWRAVPATYECRAVKEQFKTLLRHDDSNKGPAESKSDDTGWIAERIANAKMMRCLSVDF